MRFVVVASLLLAACGSDPTKPSSPSGSSVPAPQPSPQPSPPDAPAPAPAPPVTAAPDPPKEAGPARPTQLDASTGDHLCARLGDDTARCWGGGNDWGQLGDGASGKKPGPVRVLLDGVVEVTVGYNFSCARRRDRTVWCWGYNGQGQTGIPPAGDAAVRPTIVPGVTDAIDVDAGDRTACAARVDGSVWCWGQDESTGATALAPALVRGIDRVTAISVGSFVCARREDATVWCWGSNQAPTPKPIPGLVEIAEVSVGGLNACARRNDGTVWCWGFNDSGQLARGDATDGVDELVPAPGPVAGVTGATAMTTTSHHACAVVKGAVTCWGNVIANPSFPASCKKLTRHRGGGGSPAQWEFCAKPTAVAGVTGARAVATFPEGACAMTANAITCWGTARPSRLAL